LIKFFTRARRFDVISLFLTDVNRAGVSRAAWVGIVFYALCVWLVPVAPAQTDWQKDWDPGVSDSWFKEDKSNPKKPSRRISVCPECKTEADALQAALDQWYLLEFQDGERIRKDGLSKQDGDQQKAGNDCKADAQKNLGGLTEKEAKDKLPKPPKKNDKNPDKPLPDKKTAKKNIDDAAAALKKCIEDKCTPKEDGGTKPVAPGGTDQPTDGGGGGKTEVQPPPAFDITIPTLPPCFDTEKDRQKYREKLDELQKKLGDLKKIYGDQLAGATGGWQEYHDKMDKAFKDIHDQNTPGADGKDAIDKVPVPCPKGGGTPKKPGEKPKKAPRVATGHNVSFGDGPVDDFCDQIANHKINVDVVGTGETIGHVANAIVENLTDQPVEVTIPPTVLESRSKKNQHYGIPRGGDTVEVPPHGKRTVPLDGTCLTRDRPPARPDDHGDLAMGDCEPTSDIGRDQIDRMREITQYLYDAADSLEREGLLDDIPYKDPEKRKDIVKQWATWMDPEISDITGSPPATKDDLKKVVYKQAGPMTPDKREKIDKGIDNIFDKIELTTEKAKDLEKSDQDQDQNPPIPPGSYNISDETPTPAPQTEEKKPKKDKEKKKKKYPKPIQDWLDEVQKTDIARSKWASEMRTYQRHLWDWVFKNSPHAKDLYDKWKEAQKKTYQTGATQADRDAEKKALEEFQKQVNELEKDFQKTDQGKDDNKNVHDAEKELDKQKEAEKAAEKKLPEYVDKEALKQEAIPAKW